MNIGFFYPCKITLGQTHILKTFNFVYWFVYKSSPKEKNPMYSVDVVIDIQDGAQCR